MAHYWRAATYQRMGRLEDAIAGYQKTLELSPDQIQIHIDISDMYALVGDVDAAIIELELYLDKVGEGAIDPDVRSCIKTTSQFHDVLYGDVVRGLIM